MHSKHNQRLPRGQMDKAFIIDDPVFMPIAHRPSAKKFISNAEWPDTVRLGCTPNVSTDEHETAEEAQAVCNRLVCRGLGGEGKIFPIRTWVTGPKEGE